LADGPYDLKQLPVLEAVVCRSKIPNVASVVNPKISDVRTRLPAVIFSQPLLLSYLEAPGEL
jgi:hypothetical protein